MACYIKQPYMHQGDNFTYQYLSNMNLSKQQYIYEEPNIQLIQMGRDPLVQNQTCTQYQNQHPVQFYTEDQQNVRYIQQPYMHQGDNFTYQYLSNMNLSKHRNIYAEPNIQLIQMDRDPLVQNQTCAEYQNQHPDQFHTYLQQNDQFYGGGLQQNDQFYEGDLQQHAQIFRAEDIHQQTSYREVNQEEQPPLQLTTQAHVCDICNSTFESKMDLAVHYACHTGKNAHICDVCDKVFPFKSKLLRHYMIHTGDKPHVCEVCHKTFSHKHHLKSHSLVHTGQKPHVCHICKRGFTKKSALKRHFTTHTGEENYFCNICYKGFVEKIGLSIHYLLHSADQKSNEVEV